MNPISDTLISVIKKEIDRNGRQLEVLQEEAHKRGRSVTLYYTNFEMSGRRTKAWMRTRALEPNKKTTTKETSARR